MDYALGLPSFLEKEALRLVLFGGKGGTGKTTCAAASAVYLAQRRPDRKLLLVSTDPAPSLGDSLDQAVGDQVVPVEGVDNLSAWELDAGRLLAEFKRESDPILLKIVDRGTYFDREDIKDFLDLSVPGMDEFMATLALMKLVNARQYDLILLDTAPTGHTIRLLELPGQLQQWIAVLHLMMEKHRFLSRAFTGRYQPDECDRWLQTMATDARSIQRLLQNTEATEFVAITIPEELALAETVRLVSALKRLLIPIQNLLVNHVLDRERLCPSCQQRRADQAEPLEKIEREFADLRFLKVPRLPREVRGLKGLSEFAQLLTGMPLPAAGSGATPTASAALAEQDLPHRLRLPTSRFLLIGGKGGVGKTTVAAATALKLASRFPQRRILVFSIDPAHSLSDSFGQKIGAEITAISGYENLYAQEIDAPKRLEEFKREYREAVDDLFNAFLGSGGRAGATKVRYDREVMEHLLDMTPPGIDEVIAVLEIMGRLERNEFDTFVLDTAPTGHLIRFLETPDMVRIWLASTVKLLLKYRGMVRLESVAELVLNHARQARRLRALLLDASRTDFLVVTIPEAMAMAETERLLS
ncbi:MAG: ArsA family ATPase, partial [Dehalococcoidia bacterium]|nr:ArsA family ATPase [Dehalococcoidia bacterium]